MKVIAPWVSSLLLLLAAALTEVSSPDYRWVMSASALCALAAAVGFWISRNGRSHSARAAFGLLAVVAGFLTIYGAAAVISMRLNH